MIRHDVSREVKDLLRGAEQQGLKLAILGRSIALVLLAVWLLATRADDPSRMWGYVVALSAFLVLGGIQYVLIATRLDRPWMKYLFITLDIALVSTLVATQPLYPTSAELSPTMIFRAPVFPFYFLILGIATFSFSPGMVLWTGIAGAAGWLGAFAHVASRVDGLLNWTDIPARPSAAEVMAVVLDPRFGGFSARIQESVLLALVAFVIAVVMWRAHRTLERQIDAERDRATLSETFGRFVPQSVVDAMVAGHGTLAPIEREATVLFTDIAGFTTMTERAGPARTVEILNRYFDEVTRIISEHHGVVTQFQGDAVLATFNVPVADDAHASHAVQAAREILQRVSGHEFAGERLGVRVGINTGPLVAGNVGGGGRQSYTVHGDTVNLAARLEALCKEHDTSLLLSASTAKAASGFTYRPVGRIRVRGLSEEVAVYTLAE